MSVLNIDKARFDDFVKKMKSTGTLAFLKHAAHRACLEDGDAQVIGAIAGALAISGCLQPIITKWLYYQAEAVRVNMAANLYPTDALPAMWSPIVQGIMILLVSRGGDIDAVLELFVVLSRSAREMAPNLLSSDGADV